MHGMARHHQVKPSVYKTRRGGGVCESTGTGRDHRRADRSGSQIWKSFRDGTVLYCTGAGVGEIARESWPFAWQRPERQAEPTMMHEGRGLRLPSPAFGTCMGTKPSSPCPLVSLPGARRRRCRERERDRAGEETEGAARREGLSFSSERHA